MRVIVAFLLTMALAASTAAAQSETSTRACGDDRDVLTVQVQLDRLGFSPGEIDGCLGGNTRSALAAFQRSRGLSESGQADETTRSRLAEGAAEPLVTYTLSEADVAGPFTSHIPRDLMAQSKLKALHFKNPLEAIAERFHASPRLLQRLNPGATFARAGESILVPNVEAGEPAPSPPPGRETREITIVVTKATSALTIEDGGGQVLFHAPVTTGSRHDPLPIGTWKVTGVQRLPTFHYNPALFWDANPTHSKAPIPPGPNNPVGVVWIDLDKEHYGLHGTPEPSQVGHTESHGCVRLTNWDAARVASWVRPGTAVIFR